MEVANSLQQVASRYTWDPRLRRGAGAYRDTVTGRIVSNRTVRRALDSVLATSDARFRSLMAQVRAGTLRVDVWQQQMLDEIRSLHYAAAAAARGGWAQMRESDWAFARREIAFNLRHLRDWAEQVARGEALSERRAAMYANAGRSTYHKIERQRLMAAGYDEARSVRTVEDSCTDADGPGVGCVEQAALGWQPIEAIVVTGERNCLTTCQCFIEYRNSETGDVVRVD